MQAKRHNLRTTYVSCWHEGEVESEGALASGAAASVCRRDCNPHDVLRTKQETRERISALASVVFGALISRGASLKINNAMFRKSEVAEGYEKEVRAVIRQSRRTGDSGIRRRSQNSRPTEGCCRVTVCTTVVEVILERNYEPLRGGCRTANIEAELILEPFLSIGTVFFMQLTYPRGCARSALKIYTNTTGSLACPSSLNYSSYFASDRLESCQDADSRLFRSCINHSQQVPRLRFFRLVLDSFLRKSIFRCLFTHDRLR